MTGSSESVQPAPSSQGGCEPQGPSRGPAPASGCSLGRKDTLLAELAADCLKGHSGRDYTVFCGFCRHRESQSPGTWKGRKADILFCELRGPP